MAWEVWQRAGSREPTLHCAPLTALLCQSALAQSHPPGTTAFSTCWVLPQVLLCILCWEAEERCCGTHRSQQLDRPADEDVSADTWHFWVWNQTILSRVKVIKSLVAFTKITMSLTPLKSDSKDRKPEHNSDQGGLGLHSEAHSCQVHSCI